MALTPFRWIALAVIGCMLAVTAVVTSIHSSLLEERMTDDRVRVVDSAEARLRVIANRASSQSQNAALRYRLHQIMDSARRIAARAPDTGVVRVFVSDGHDRRLRALLDESLRRARAERIGSQVGVDVFLLTDTTRQVRGVPRYQFGMEVVYDPPVRVGDRCRVYLRNGFRRSLPQNMLASEIASQQMLGLCGLYSSFGVPGPSIADWIEAGGWRYATEGSWTVAARPLPLREDPGIFKGFSTVFTYLNIEMGGPACMAGDLGACGKVATSFRSRAPSRIGSSTYPMSLGSRRWEAGFGYLGGEFLSDAVRDLGRERFRAFWTSPDSLHVAFENATGERWEAYVRRWMASRYGELRAGPRVSAFALGSAAALVAIAIGLTMLMSVRRTYV